MVACNGAGAAFPVDAGVADATPPGVPDTTPPRVAASSPPHDAIGVYPARLFGGTVPRVRITIRFDEPMDPARATVRWGATGGGMAAQAIGTWSPDAFELVIDLLGAPLTGQRPLADLTGYELDLGDLRDPAGNGVVPDVGLDAGKLRFTTAAYDPLLTHACGHVVFGPYAEVAAAATPSPLAARTDVAHTRYTVSLPDAGGNRTGYTRIRATADATWHLFLEDDRPVALETEAGAAVPLVTEATPDACDGIRHRATFQAAALDQRFLRFGPQAEPVTRLIVEVVAQ